MFHKINLWLTKFSQIFNPFCQKLTPLYKKIKPYQDKISSKFFKLFQKYLRLSAKEKQHILSGNQVKMFRLYTFLAVVLNIFTFVVISHSYCFLWCSLFLILPLVFLLFRGYRISYLLLIIYNTFATLLLLICSPSSVLAIVFWWALAIVVSAFGFKYENARINMEKSGELKLVIRPTQKDLVTAILISLLAFVLSQLVAFFQSPSVTTAQSPALKNSYQINRDAGMLSRHLFGYAEFCREQGYELKIYPVSVSRYFAPEIAQIQEKLKAQNSSLTGYYNQAKKIYGRKLIESIASEMDGIRRQAIVEMVALNQNVNPSQIQWNNNMNNLISMQEACVLFDEISENTIAAAGRELHKID